MPHGASSQLWRLAIFAESSGSLILNTTKAGQTEQQDEQVGAHFGDVDPDTLCMTLPTSNTLV